MSQPMPSSGIQYPEEKEKEHFNDKLCDGCQGIPKAEGYDLCKYCQGFVDEEEEKAEKAEFFDNVE